MISEQLQKKIDRSIKLLRTIANAYGDVIELAYSGGKDSDVILQLARESGIKFRAIYKNTTIDPPGTIAHAKEMGVEIMQPKETFFQLIAKRGFPNRNKRHCCKDLKEFKVLDKCIIGVRKSESKKRDKRYNAPTECLGTKANPREAIYPILHWTDADVRDFILDRGIKCAPVYYDWGGQFHVERRLGCMGCPLQSQKKRLAEFKKRPRLVKAWMRAGQKFRDTHPDSVPCQNYADIYEWITRELFFGAEIDFENFRNGFFGKPDYKALLEEYFNIDLTI